ncbi:hypothetical protein, partial [uncultured Acidaminococcus sp.]|uniref:hypothetical protein n=1 Tax=uncultured Acidaminococcus sp. TaxID=352152 RepID=UPI0025DF0323
EWMPSMSTFLCKNGVRKEYFLTPTFIIEPKKQEPKPEPISTFGFGLFLCFLGLQAFPFRSFLPIAFYKFTSDAVWSSAMASLR